VQERHALVDGRRGNQAFVRAAWRYTLPACTRVKPPGGDMQFQRVLGTRHRNRREVSVKLGESSRIGRSLEQFFHDDRRDGRFAGVQQFPQSAEGTVSQLRNRSIPVESTRITGHPLTDRAHNPRQLLPRQSARTSREAPR
jgi:hypothetical protein